jgi:hypothetical protein
LISDYVLSRSLLDLAFRKLFLDLACEDLKIHSHPDFEAPITLFGLGERGTDSVNLYKSAGQRKMAE